MTTPVLAPPPHETRRADPVPDTVPVLAVRRERPVISPPRAHRGLPVGRGPLAASLLVHAAAAAAILLLVTYGPRPTPVERVATAESVEYIDLAWPAGVPGDGAGMESSPAAEPAAVNDQTAPRRQPDAGPLVFPGRVPTGISAPASSGVGNGASGGAADGRAGGVSERLQPGFRDPRLYVAPGDLPSPEQTNQQRYMEHLSARIEASNDSAGIANRGPNTDWTVRDGSGRRWGLSEDGLHLGPVTIPKELVPRPTATGTNQKREQAEREQQQRTEIQRQEDDRARREAREEAIRATRERAEEQRRSQAGGGN